MIATDQSKESVQLTLEGDLNAPTVEELRPRLKALITEGYRFFIVDFAQCQFMCSAALGLLVELHHGVTAQNGRITVINTPPTIEKLLRSTKLIQLFSEETADTRKEDPADVLSAVQDHVSQELLFLSDLNTISGRVLRADLTEDVYQVALREVLRSLHSEAGVLLLLDGHESDRVLRLAAAEGFDENVRDALIEFRLQPGTFEARCIDRAEAAFYGDDKQTESQLLKLCGGQTGILAPIAGRQNVLGVLLVEAAEDASAFFPHSTPLLQVFANVCGLAIEKQAMLEDIRYKNDRLSRALSELNRTQDSLMEAGKLAVVGAMMRALSHALNNKLVPIMGYSQLLGELVGNEPGVRDKVRIVEDASLEIKDLIDRVRSLVVGDDLNLRNCDVCEVIDSALYILDYLFRENRIRVSQQVAAGTDTTIVADRDRLIQAFLALFHRLPEACRDQAKPALDIRVEREDNHLCVELVDNGYQIPGDLLQNMLNPFDGFDTPHATDRLNFSIASSVIRDHHGRMTIEHADDGQGVRVRFQLPVQSLART